MQLHLIVSRRAAAHTLRLLVALAFSCSLAAPQPLHAQTSSEEAPPSTALQPSLIEILEKAPKTRPAVVGQDGFAPGEVGAAALADLPDRTQFAVMDYTVEGAIVNATVQLPASQGVYIASGFPNSNFLNESTMQLGWDNQTGRQAMRMLLEFNLAGLPPQSQIQSAAFFINQTRIEPPGDGQGMSFRAQLMQQPWAAGSVTWNNANFLGGAEFPLGSIPPALGWVTGPATAAVRTWASGEPNRGLIITGDETPTPGRWRQFWGVGPNSPPQLSPYLEVTFTANCDTQPPIATVNALPTFSPAEFRVFWSAFDPAQPGCPASGVAWYNVQYRINGGSWVNWRNQTETDNFGFRRDAPNGATVEFRVQAADNAGNVGPWSQPVSTIIDSEPPVAAVNPLPQYTIFPAFTVTWSGTDNLSGIAYYNLQVRVNNGAWVQVLSESTAVSFQITGAQFRDKFDFRVQAVDNVGNVQPWSPTAQATTVVFDHPVARVLPFNPALIQSTSPVTNVITVNWQGFFAPGTTITSYELRYRYAPFGGAPGAWTTWSAFPGSQTSANFTPAQGNGLYEFFAIATNNVGQVQPFEPDSGLSATVILDLEDTIQVRAYMPLAFHQGVD
ncbi:MAG: DNRLRE domain-containing protein [Caldilinea sp.]|uniref:DNRLRE domain-containing protein n=1 Tax=Caldilinea sp. TaxID=2293560 RepID=UPI0030994541